MAEKEKTVIKLDSNERDYVAMLNARIVEADNARRSFFQFVLHKNEANGSGWTYKPDTSELVRNGKEK